MYYINIILNSQIELDRGKLGGAAKRHLWQVAPHLWYFKSRYNTTCHCGIVSLILHFQKFKFNSDFIYSQKRQKLIEIELV